MREKLSAILANYGFALQGYKAIRSGERDVWYISTASIPLILKRLNKSSPFSLYVHEELFKKKVPLPYLHKTQKGELYVQYQQQLFALFTFVPGSKPKKNINNWKILCQSLALFHAQAQHLTIPRSLSAKSNWPTTEAWLAQKKKQLHFIMKQKDHPLLGKRKESAKLFKQVQAQAEQSIKRCEQAPFAQYVHDKQNVQQLCHGDYGETSNFLINHKQHYIIDLDEVYYGLPINDLSHLLRKSVRKPELTLHMLGWYLHRQLQRVELEVIKADLSFPHLFYHALRNHALRGRRRDEILPFLMQIAKIEEKRVDDI